MISLFPKPGTVLGIFVCLMASTVAAQTAQPVPAMHVDPQTQRVQKQADEVYERTEYRRAFFIYRNELAPIGDKYGQYMVGFMYLTGKGIEEDPVAASAWYRLSAERGTPEFIQVRDQLMAGLTADQRAQSDLMFLQLRREYGDLALLTRAVREDYEELQRRTGSRLGTDTGPVTIIDSSGAISTRMGSDYYDRIERRIKSRLAYISEHTDIEISDVDAENLDIEKIERQVMAHLSRIN